MLPTAALAQWRTTQIAPIPVGEVDTETDDEALGWDVSLIFTSRDDLIADARDYMNTFIPIAEGDLAKLEAAGFPDPLATPLIVDQWGGQRFIPLVWKPISAPARQNCILNTNAVLGTQAVRSQSEINSTLYPYSRLQAAYVAGDPRKQEALDFLSTVAVHEITHAIQYRAWTPNCEESQLEKWLTEGTADAVAYYLLTKRRTNALEEFFLARSKRAWNLAMDMASTDDTITYTVASFYRYVMEASEGGHNGGGLAFIKDILNTSVSALEADAVGELDRIVTAYAGEDLNRNPRTLYNVLPEFLTEYGSYGGSRYTKYAPVPGMTASLDHKKWLHDTFSGCLQATIDHSDPFGSIDRISISIEPLAGECLHVRWINVKQPVSLQLIAKNIPNQHGDLHIGEAVRDDVNGLEYCWNAVQSHATRIEDIAIAKCMLSRATPLVGSSKMPDTKLAMWNLDYPIEGTGEAFLILSNVHTTPSQTKPINFELIVGAMNIDYQIAAITPRAAPGTPAVADGLANLDARLIAFSGNDNRSMFDGRIIDGPGPDFDLPSGVLGDGAAQGLLTFIRGGNYWVGVANHGGQAQDPRDAAFIFKDPQGMEQNFQSPGGLGTGPMMAIMMATPMSGGTIADIGRARQCGFEMTPDIRIEAVTEDALNFSVEGNLFDMSRAMSGAGGSPCAAIQLAFVERARFTVSLPYGPLYDGSSRVVEQSPPGQTSYDGNFPDGPAYGGIASARTYRNSARGTSGGAGTGSGPGDGAVTRNDTAGDRGGDGTSSELGEICDCRCPRSPLATLACQQQCQPFWAQCSVANAPPDARSAFDALLGRSGLSPQQRDVLSADFEALSPETKRYLLELGRGVVKANPVERSRAVP